VTFAAAAVGVAFTLIGAGAERLASVWPTEEASRRAPGIRTLLLGLAAGLAGGAIAWRSTLPAYALAVHLLILAMLVVLTATDLEQRRLPSLLLDALIVVAALFVLFNPQVGWLDAIIGGAVAVAFMGVLGLVVRGGVALGDLYLVGPIGLILGWPSIFVAVFAAGLLSAVVSALLLLSRRAGLKTYIPFGPFLVAGMVIALLRDPALLGPVATTILTALSH
jgi:prepilin signal peptidase PulO-like enzyme (type II secretory pathway)